MSTSRRRPTNVQTTNTPIFGSHSTETTDENQPAPLRRKLTRVTNRNPAPVDPSEEEINLEEETEIVEEQPVEEPIPAPTRRRRVQPPVVEEPAPTRREQEPVVEEEVVEEPIPAPTRRVQPKVQRRVRSVAPPRSEPVEVPETQEPEKKTGSNILLAIQEINAILDDKSLDVNAKKNIEKRLKEYETSTANTDALIGIKSIAKEIFSYAWDTPKKRPIYIHDHVRDFENAADFGLAYEKTTIKGKVNYREVGELRDLLYSMDKGVSNVIIQTAIAKLYALINDIKLPLPEGSKRTPQTSVKADELMIEYLSDVMGDMADEDMEYNAKLESKNLKTKTKRKVLDPENIPRQRFSKMFTYGTENYTDVATKKEVIEQLKNDEILLRDTIQYHESVLRKQRERVKKEEQE